MKRDKYMGLDVHQAMTVVAVMNADGKIVLETMVPTAAAAIREMIESLSGPLHVTLEETTQAEWLYEVIRDLVSEVVVCDPRRNKLLTEGSKGDKPDARRLAELLRAGMVRSVWHGHEKTRTLKEMVRAYETFTRDTNRTMLRIKAIYRSRGIATEGSGVYQATQREQWLGKIGEVGMRQRAAWLYEQLDQAGNCASKPKPACWRRAALTAPSLCCEAFPNWVRSDRRRLSPRPIRHTGFEPSGSSGATAAWELSRTAARSTSLRGDGCSDDPNRWPHGD